MNTSTPSIVCRSFPRRDVLRPRDDIEAKASRIAARIAAVKSKPLAPAVFIGVQSGFGLVADFELFNLTADVSPMLLKNSTVTRDSLERAGFYVPTILPAQINQVKAERSYGEITA